MSQLIHKTWRDHAVFHCSKYGEMITNALIVINFLFLFSVRWVKTAALEYASGADAHQQSGDQRAEIWTKGLIETL